tara:strand:+ start:2704 stop:3348 length:645 start_codon:yes stop_codon:yes gene_type:complete
MKLKLTDLPVVYINLDDQPKRKETLEENLKQLGFKNIIRVSGFKDPIGKRGCAYSHALALEEVDPPFILLEDDCLPLNFIDEVDIPDDADAVYLGVSSWGRMNGHSGPCVQREDVDNYDNLVKIYNMVGAHAILYINSDYIDLCKRIAYHGYLISDHHDIGFADVQRYYDVYAFDNPMFYQTSSNGTDQALSSYPSVRMMSYDERFWLPLEVKE